MILQVATDTRQIRRDPDVERPQIVSSADARQHEQPR